MAIDTAKERRAAAGARRWTFLRRFLLAPGSSLDSDAFDRGSVAGVYFIDATAPSTGPPLWSGGMVYHGGLQVSGLHHGGFSVGQTFTGGFQQSQIGGGSA